MLQKLVLKDILLFYASRSVAICYSGLNKLYNCLCNIETIIRHVKVIIFYINMKYEYGFFFIN